MVDWVTPEKCLRRLMHTWRVGPAWDVSSCQLTLPPLVLILFACVNRELSVRRCGCWIFKKEKKCILKPFSEKNAIHYNQGSFLSAIPGGFSSVVPTEGQHRPAVDRPLALEEERCRCFVPDGHCAWGVLSSHSCLRSLSEGPRVGRPGQGVGPGYRVLEWILQSRTAMATHGASHSRPPVQLIHHKAKLGPL